MIDAKVKWIEKLSFEAALESGYQVPLDAAVEVGGAGKGLLPMEMLAAGLAGCTAMDVISILQKKRQQVTRFEVQVHLERAAEHPRVFTRGEIEYFVSGHEVDEAAVVRAIELSATRYCPAQAMFSRIFPIDLTYHILEDQGEGVEKPIKSAKYIKPGNADDPVHAAPG